MYESPGRTGVSQMIASFVKLSARSADWNTVRSVVTHDHQCFLNTIDSTQLAGWLVFEAQRRKKQAFPADIDEAKRDQILELSRRSPKAHG